ncbi:hypothetical protein CYY_003738 [Polysphondylium violaceum]|uniref:ABC transporter domain-containing protein n=1 Tax=Polysphondylium violaceum TaxID=133409 RepID=A0A8J4PYM4_9MYCE|nr:hypothetical protein CYY_003738 [Polysphondylium violaceum]
MIDKRNYIFIQFKAILKKNFLLQFKQVKSNVIQLVFIICVMVLLIYTSRDIVGGYDRYEYNRYIDFDYYITNSAQEYPYNQILSKYWAVDPPQSSSKVTAKDILGNLPQYVDKETNITVPIVEYFPYADYNQMDSKMITFWNDTFSYWKNIAFKNVTSDLSKVPPYYTIYFNTVEDSNGGKKKLNYTIENLYQELQSVYYQSLFLESRKFNEAYTLISFINNAYLKYLTPKEDNFIWAVKQQYIDRFTSERQNTFSFVLCIVLLPPVVSMVFTTFVHSLVTERAELHMSLMNLMGLKTIVYMASNAVYFFCVFMIFVVIVMLLGTIGLVPLFTGEFFRLLVLFISYGLSLSSLSFSVSAFFSSTKMSSVLSYILILITPLVGSLLDLYFYSGHLLSAIYLVFPPFTFQHGMYLLCVHLADHYEKFPINSQFTAVIFALLFQSIAFFLLGIYLTNVLPKKFGYSRSPLYPIKGLIHYINNRFLKRQNQYSNFDSDKEIEIEITDEDYDCKEERRRAYDQDNNYILRSVNLSKTYKTGKINKQALSNFCLTGQRGEILALLGPNGSGKTTFLNLLCGVHRPTSGDAFINGLRISTEMESIYSIVSICFQKDILYEELTVLQHMEFFFGIKKTSIGATSTSDLIKKILEGVLLYDELNAKAKNLSGGQRRRLSIAISLIGDSKILLLDEPTTGVAPDSKRTCWDVIQSIKSDKLIILTTHSLEEANELADKLAIISSGQLQCIGTSTHLKHRFGSGFSLDIILYAPEYKLQLIDSVLSQVPSAQPKETIIPDEATFIIPNQTDIIKLFTILNEKKEEYGIKSWSVSHSSLDDVFDQIVNQREEIQ